MNQKFVAWLEASGLTQNALAEKIGVGQPYVSRLVSGARSPGRAVALAIQELSKGRVPASSWSATGPTLAITRGHHAPRVTPVRPRA